MIPRDRDHIATHSSMSHECRPRESSRDITHSLPKRRRESLSQPGPSRSRSRPSSTSSDGGGSPTKQRSWHPQSRQGSGSTPRNDDPRGWTYRLVVIQQPQRARACGFGDKDRRPLSPPPIIQLLVFDRNGLPVHPERIETSFMIVKVDLWNEAGDEERNVVMHSTSGGRQVSPSPFTRQPLLHSGAPLARPGTAERSAPSRIGSYGSQRGPGQVVRISPKLSPHSRLSDQESQIPDAIPVPSSPLSSSALLPVPAWSRPGMSRASSYIGTGRPGPPVTDTSRPTTEPGGSAPPIYRSVSHGKLPDAAFRSPSGGYRHPLTLPPLTSITETDESRGSRSSSRMPTLREYPQFQWSPSRPDTASTSASAGDQGRDRRIPSWSTESSRPPTDYSWGARSGSSSTHRSSVSSISGWPPAHGGTTQPGPRSGPSVFSRPTEIQLPARRPSEGFYRDTYSSPSYIASPLSVVSPADASPHAYSFAPTENGESTSPVVLSVHPPGPGQPSLYAQQYIPGPARRVSVASLGAANAIGPSAGPGPPGSEPTFSRVLVGADVCSCQKLLGEDGKLGMFFFAHDLGVRTEGTFRLRFSLSNLANIMSAQDRDLSARISAVSFSEPFTVYSAKRFPGVIPTTSLTRVFAQQNVRLPTRQKREQPDSPRHDGQGGGDSDEDS